MLLNGWETLQTLFRRFLGLEQNPPAIEHQIEPSRQLKSRIILRAKPKQFEVQDLLNGLSRDKSILKNIKKMPDREKIKLVN
jgi:hypothetical protein